MTKRYEVSMACGEEFHPILLDHVENIPGVEVTDYTRGRGVEVEFQDWSLLKNIYDALPWSVQKCLWTGFMSDRSGCVLSWQGSLIRGNEDNGSFGVDLYQSLSESDYASISQRASEELFPTDSGRFVGIEDGELLIEAKESSDIENMLREIAHNIGGVIKYVRDTDRSQIYAVYLEKHPHTDHPSPAEKRFYDIQKQGHFDCPRCDQKTLTLMGPTRDEFRAAFTCRTCGLAINRDYASRALDELESDIPKDDLKEIFTEWAKEDLETDIDAIDIRSHLTLISTIEGTKVYKPDEDYIAGDYALWAHPQQSPMLFYSISRNGFDISVEPIENMCQICTEAGIKRQAVWGAYYKEGVGFHETQITVCDDCLASIDHTIRAAIQKSDIASEVVGKLI